MIDTNKVAELSERILADVSRVIVGKDELKRTLLIALLAGGHVLIEGLPGTAKTKPARTFAAVIGGEFKRIQFTPDMLLADITGFYIYSPMAIPGLSKGRYSPTSCWPMRSTGLLPGPSRRFWRRCRNIRSPSNGRPISSPGRSW